jgi:hypothetical protein
MLGSTSMERLQLGHWLTSVGDDERPALSDLLQVPSEPGLEFAHAHRRMSRHVVMMTTSTAVVNQAGPVRSPSNLRVPFERRGPQTGTLA